MRIVAKGHPSRVASLGDLEKEGLKISLCDSRYSLSGIVIDEMLKNLPNADAVRKNVVNETKGHHTRATEVAMGTVDVATIWDGIADQFSDRLDIITIPDSLIDGVTSATYGYSDLRNIKVMVGVTSYAGVGKHVRGFYRFLAENGPSVFTSMGFSPVKDTAGERGS